MRESVELRDIRVFLVLAEVLHFGQTAERVRLTQPRVSQIIAAWERRAGGPLFLRTSRKVELTARGERLRVALAPAYAQFDSAVETALGEANGVSGALRVGMYLPISGGPHFAAITEAFVNAYPAASVEVVDLGISRNTLDALRAGETDLLAQRLPVSDPDLVVGPRLSRNDERIAIVARHHPLAERESIEYEELGDFVLSDAPGLPSEMFQNFVPPRTPSGRLIRRQVINTFFEHTALVAAGKIVHPTVRSYLDHLNHPNIIGVPIRDLPPSETALVWQVERDGHPAIQAFVRTAASVIAEATAEQT
ncbi:LysR family transcriptional regulator [Aeromicrobium sp. 9AM]|uniref:LysR family transcriptional regulator n=1 Tax=Aeromicrobium sp. 9AM TaxID=2653126 RepID=UPI0012F0DF40|nr:LysR family transcriptional regulator [Aeromicrobium sp. 9AM]VXB01616.1 DNA-binding transcriptional regulator, LysR family [Aeromicrobium sp. 9AM]